MTGPSAASALGDLQAGRLGHLDVEKGDVDAACRDIASAAARRVGAVRPPLRLRRRGSSRSTTIDRASGSSSATSTRKRSCRHAADQRGGGRISSTIVPAGAFGRTIERRRRCRTGASMRERVLRRPVPASRRRSKPAGRPTPLSVTHSRSSAPFWRAAPISSRPVADCGARPWRSAFSTSGCSSNVGTSSRRHGVVDVVRDLEAIAEPRALEIDVALDHAQLVAERRQLAGRPIERRPHQVAQSEQHRQRRLVALSADQRRDRVQRVEQEVRLDFQPQRVELRARQLGFELRSREARAAARARCAANARPPTMRRPATSGSISTRAHQRLARAWRKL